MVNRILSLAALGLLCAGCADKPGKTLVVPEEMRRSGPKGGSSTSSSSSAARDRYVMRIAEGGRVWEVELPEGEAGYQVRIPLRDSESKEAFSAADEEVVRQLEREQLAKAGDGAPVKAEEIDARLLAKRKSYLGGLAKVNEMYSSRRFELALIELVNLEKDYPNDARILAMKGSLYLKLGKNKLARDSWEKALAQNPEDEAVAEALRNLASATE